MRRKLRLWRKPAILADSPPNPLLTPLLGRIGLRQTTFIKAYIRPSLFQKERPVGEYNWLSQVVTHFNWVKFRMRKLVQLCYQAWKSLLLMTATDEFKSVHDIVTKFNECKDQGIFIQWMQRSRYAFCINDSVTKLNECNDQGILFAFTIS